MRRTISALAAFLSCSAVLPALAQTCPSVSNIDLAVQIPNSFVVGDVISSEPGQEMISVASPRLNVWREDGTLIESVVVPDLQPTIPTLADIDGDSTLEIVVGTSGSGLYVLNEVLGDFTAVQLSSGYFSAKTPVVVDDLDGDGEVEIVEIDEGPRADDKVVIIHIRDATGVDLIPPIEVVNMPSFHSPLSVVDINNDGQKEIFVQTKDRFSTLAGLVHAIDSRSGSVLWTVSTLNSYIDLIPGSFIGDSELNDVVAADFSKDGQIEILTNVTTASLAGQATFILMYDLDENGDISGIAQLDIPADELNSFYIEHQHLSVGNLDQDPFLEFSMAGTVECPSPTGQCGKLYVWDVNENLEINLAPGFPIVIEDNVIGTPMIADVDHDGFSELVSTLSWPRTTNAIYAWRKDGSLVDCWPLDLGGVVATDDELHVYKHTTLVDVEGDNNLDMLITTGATSVEPFKIELNHAASYMPQPQYGFDNGHTRTLFKNTFVRGDADGLNGFVPLADAVFLLKYQFLPGSPPPPCLKAADVDDNGVVQPIVDALYALSAVFTPGAPGIPAPFPDEGEDPTADALGCH